MATIRNFEERGIPETGQRAMSASVHSSAGQEAVPTGICAHLTDDDYIGSTHRGHGHCIAKGVDPKRMMAELFGRSTGSNKGKGGSMHIADMSKGMLGTNGVVAASVPLAVGAALWLVEVEGPTARIDMVVAGDGGVRGALLPEVERLLMEPAAGVASELASLLDTRDLTFDDLAGELAMLVANLEM